MRQRGFIAFGNQTGPFAVHLAHFVLQWFKLFPFHTGRPILITPEIGVFSQLQSLEWFQVTCVGLNQYNILWDAND